MNDCFNKKRLRSLFGVAHGGEAPNELRRDFVERADELGDRRLHGAEELRQQLLAARHRRQRLDSSCVHDVVGHCADFDGKLVISLGKVVQQLCGGHRILGNSVDQGARKLAGPLIYGISKDPVAAAKLLNDFAKGNDKLTIKIGAMPNYVMDAVGVKALATMPSREELLSKLLGTMQAPITQFVRTLNEIPTKFVRGLAAVRDAKETA